MPVSNPNKTISINTLDCGGSAIVTLSFDAEPLIKTAPADIVLVMDRSGSMNGAPIVAAKAAAKQLIETIALASGSPDGTTIENGSQLSLVSFASDATTDVPLTGDVVALESGIDSLSAGGLTNHEAAFQQAELQLQTATAGRKIVIMFTDGTTTTGGNPNPVAETIKQSGAEIYCIGLSTGAGPLDVWASAPISTHVALTDDVNQLGTVFAQVAAEVVLAGAQDMKLIETLNPDFKIVRASAPTDGVVEVLDPQTLRWTAGAIGAAGPQQASVSFEITHIGTTGGIKKVNDSVTYTDRAGTLLTFPDPEVDVNCTGPVIHPEPCPLPSTFLVDSCQDAAVVQANDTVLYGLGRIVQVDVLVKHVCPGKRVAVAIILTELDADGVEHNRGTKSVLIPAQTGADCQDILLKCVSFVVPESLDLAGTPDSICEPRGFRTRVLANYVDSDFVCCDPQTVIL